MRTQLFDVPGSLRVEYQEHKEGPSPVYVVWKPGTSQTFRERSPLLKFAQWPAALRRTILTLACEVIAPEREYL